MDSMSDVAAARDALDRAQALLDEVNADAGRFDEFLAWLPEAEARLNRLDDYYRDAGQTDIATVLESDVDDPTPAVANEDSVWEAVVGFDERMRRLLRIVTASLTSTLDDASDD